MFKPKIYFACSIRGGRDDADYYKKIVDSLKLHAYVLTEIFADNSLTEEGMALPTGDIWSNDMHWIEEADALVAEVTQPSLGVGYEIAKAERMGKPVLCLYRPTKGKKLSAMVAGSPVATVVEYENLSTVEHAVEGFLANIRPMDRRAV